MKLNFITFGDLNGNRGSTRIRVLNLVQALKQRGCECEINGENFEGYDAIIFQKTPLSLNFKEAIQKARRKNIPIVFDLDDYMEEYLPLLKYYDLIIVSTEYLKNICLKYHPNVEVVPNCLDVDDINIPLKKDNKHQTAVWYGYSLNSYILKLWDIKGIKKISEKNCDIVYDAAKIDSQLQKFDLVIIPQEKNALTLSKTHCRMLKAIYLGVPCLISDMPVYLNLAEELGFPKEFIVHNNNEWNKKIADFKAGRLKFDFDFVAARQKIMEKYSADKIAEIFQNTLTDFINGEHKKLATIREDEYKSAVSVVIKISDRSEDNLKTLESVLAQTIFDLEIIFCGENLPAEVNTIMQKDGRIFYNKIPDGKYVYFINGGDEIEKDCLKKMFVFAQTSEAEITMMRGFWQQGAQKEIIPSDKCSQKITDIRNITEFLDYPLVFGTCLYLRYFLVNNGIWEPQLQILPDQDFAYLVWEKRPSLYVLNENFLKINLQFKPYAEIEKNSVELLKNYAKATSSLMPTKNKFAVIQIIKDKNDIIPAFITMQSIIKNVGKQIPVHLFHSVVLSSSIEAQFKNSGEVYLHKTNFYYNEPLNILFSILNQWHEKEQVLYVSNSCLVISDFSDIFSLENESLLASRVHNGSLDTNVILFNTKLFREQFLNHYFYKKITEDVWNALMYCHNKDLPAQFDYFAEDFKDLSTKTLSKTQIICYKIKKPWKDLYSPFAFMWWQYARQSVFYETLMTQMSWDFVMNAEQESIELSALFESYSEEIYSLMKEYIKEALLSFVTFGNASLNHKLRLSLIAKKISEWVVK